jgi:hypothetical protein
MNNYFIHGLRMLLFVILSPFHFLEIIICAEKNWGLGDLEVRSYCIFI